MKCSNCGAESDSKICKICGNKATSKKYVSSKKIYKFLIDATYIINCIFFPPAKIMAIIWTCCCIIMLRDPSFDTHFIYKFLVIVFGYCFYCGIADAIYASKKLRYNKYKLKVTNKKEKRLHKLHTMMRLPRKNIIEKYKDAAEINSILHLQKRKLPFYNYYEIIDELNNVLGDKIAIAKQYAELSNNTTDEDIYCYYINKCIETIEWMVQFEKYGIYTEGMLPSDNIKELKYNIPFRIEQLRHKKEEEKNNVLSKADYDSMDGHDFEYFCADLLRKNGFINVEVTQGSGDHGIDILAEKDGVYYAIQCKCYSSNVGNASVQQAHTGKSLYHKDIAVVMTNQYFTQQAKEEAALLGVKLWDRNKLNELINL